MKTSRIQILTLAVVTTFVLGSPLTWGADEKKSDKPAAGKTAKSETIEKPPPKANLNGVFTGSYTYGEGYTLPLRGSTVTFRIEISQKDGSSVFSGVIDESYS